MMLSDSRGLMSVKMLAKRNSYVAGSAPGRLASKKRRKEHGCLYLVALLKGDCARVEETRIHGRKSECCRSARVRENV